jgi:metal-dependent HD superfamily phosphatase/phosphodiesterase
METDTVHPLTLKDVKANPKVKSLITGANEVMKAMGYTEHGHRHAGVVSSITRVIMDALEMPQRQIELGMIAAYLHDIGNVINRVDHPISGANMAFTLLNEMEMPPDEIGPILGAIGNHEELKGTPISVMSAALIIADKSDVHYSRVQNSIMETYDIHDRVNYAVQKSRVNIEPSSKQVSLNLEIDVKFASVMEYFEIFLSRMVMCRHASATFGYEFELNVNGTQIE